MRIHAAYRSVATGERDTACKHDAGPWTDDVDEVTCVDCLKILFTRRETLR